MERCYSCKLPLVEDFYVHPDSGELFCMLCSWGMPLNPQEIAMILLTQPGSVVGPPFAPGDVVECRRAAQVYEGIGVVREMSMDPEHAATPLYPMFRVELTDKANDDCPDEAWYAEVSLTKVKQEQGAGVD